jgi:hypothetical protein
MYNATKDVPGQRVSAKQKGTAGWLDNLFPMNFVRFIWGDDRSQDSSYYHAKDQETPKSAKGLGLHQLDKKIQNPVIPFRRFNLLELKFEAFTRIQFN